uniref:Secreted Defensin-like peptide n=1 Tax=Pristhesancus plagipennis TaxID=1955184 RepID=A0A2K8JUY5_PRIPG|nr:secreted Defensin-like peptide [Pristhesancus plagipennis]
MKVAILFLVTACFVLALVEAGPNSQSLEDESSVTHHRAKRLACKLPFGFLRKRECNRSCTLQLGIFAGGKCINGVCVCKDYSKGR